MRYRDAGVDIARADALKGSIGRAVRKTWTASVRLLPNGFAGIMEWPGSGRTEGGPGRADAPLLLAATMDGVGTKLTLARAAGRTADAAADLVYHGANDLLVHGARPLAFLDYIAQGELEPEVVTQAIEGLSRACHEVGAVLLGGETAEMPDTYRSGTLDVAGCMIGTVTGSRLLDGRAARPGDRVLGLASSGLHTNGYSDARRVLDHLGLAMNAPLPGQRQSIVEALLEPHRWYGPALLPQLELGRVHALAHVTGGGLPGNLPRVLPDRVRAVIHAGRWERPAIFRWLIEAGSMPEEDARTTFNLGIGMAVICSPGQAVELTRACEQAGETVHDIGELIAGERGVDWIGDA